MRDQSRIVANTLLTYAARVLVGVIGILLVPFMLHRLGDVTYGVIGVTAAILQVLVLIELGVRPAATRQFTLLLAEDQVDRANQLASSAFAVYACMALAILALAGAVGAFSLDSVQVPPDLHAETRVVLMLVALAAGANLLRAPYEAALASQLRYDVPQYADASSWLLRAGLIVGGFTVLSPRLWIWAVGVLAAALLSFAVMRWQAQRLCTTLRVGRPLMSRLGLRDLAGVSAYTSVLRISEWLVDTSGPLIVSAFLGIASVAHYTPAVTLVFALQPLTRGFLSQLVPVVTRAVADGDRGRVRRILIRSTRYSLLVGGAATVAVGATADTAIRVWLGPGYGDTARVLALWCAVGLLRAAVGAAFPVFMGTGSLRVLASLNAVLAVATVAGAVALIRWADAGVEGVAVAVLTTQAVRSVVYVVHSARLADVGLGEYARMSFAGPAICLAVFGASLLWLGAGIEATSVGGLALQLALGAGLLAPVVWILGLTADDRSELLAYANRGVQLLRGGRD